MGDDDEKETVSETKVKSATLGDHLTGNAGENGEKLENGHPVTETTTKETK